jgi:cell division transport system ATP-binding protein
LLADEPTGNLDPKLSLDIIRLFEEFNAAGVTVLIATHDLGLIARMRYRTLTLKEGTMINDGIIEGLSANGMTPQNTKVQEVTNG